MSLQKSFQLTALAVAMGMSMATQATTITESSVDAGVDPWNVNISAYEDVNVGAVSNVNIYADNNNGSYGSFNVFKGAAGVPGTVALITADDNFNGGTVINTDTTINGNLSVSSLNGVNLSAQALQQIGFAEVVNAEAATRAAADTAESNARAAADVVLQNNINAEAATRLAADTQLQANIGTEAATRAAADTAITDGIAAGVTTASLTVNGPSQLNGEVTVNNVKSTTITDQAGTPATTPEFGADVNGDGRPDTLLQTKEQTDAVTVNTQSQVYNENNLTFSSKVEKGTTTTTDQYTADISYDANGVATYGPNSPLGQTTTLDLEKVAEDTIIVGKETAGSETALTVRSKDVTGEFETVVTSKDVTTGNVSASSITLDGQDLATTIANGDAATLASANATTASTAATLRDEAAAESARVNTAIVDGDAATLASANATTATTAATLRDEAAAESARVNTAIVDGDAATLASANATTASTAATLRDEAAAESARVNTAIVDGDAATLASANATTATTAATLRSEATAESARVNTAIVDGDTATLASANATTATTAATLRSEATAEFARVNQAMVSGDAATLSSAKTYADAGDTATLVSANAYTNTQVANVNSRVNQLNSRVDDVEKTSYRGIAIALAAQQQIPNIGAGQFAVFGGVGHYEGESAGALGVASVFADGRTSVSAALGFAGGSEVGGRVGVSYVFGGK
ncbi:YadA-like family protein [Acinetobacter terrae]|uniref:Trimeric autotransporter adhesin YadA-like C-terminal membrane anchor domain-containing protein n=1 Tax=Acinetobacter terrae TaxID=2731247 RepID=A0ABX1V506_9GAMM|nr:YadA C-terminal domain-containing protein [Acinetobacter terrae]NNH88705.1 hypothetical protein [Acinetobacter terrae]